MDLRGTRLEIEYFKGKQGQDLVTEWTGNGELQGSRVTVESFQFE